MSIHNIHQIPWSPLQETSNSKIFEENLINRWNGYPCSLVVLAVRRGVCSRRSLKMNWSFSPCSSLWVMPKVEWWSHFSPRDSNLWKVSLMMISWNCNITLMNEMSNMAAPKAHLSSFSSYFPGNHSRKINILNGILIIPFFATKAKSASFFFFFSGKSQ